jgi:hypothetical protein
MKFQATDFQGDTVTRLGVIIQSKMGNSPLLQFRDMGESQQKKFNRLLNEYVKMLGEDWEKEIMDQFNLICQEDVFTESFDPSKLDILMNGGNRELLLTDEQKSFITNDLGKSIDDYTKEVVH